MDFFNQDRDPGDPGLFHIYLDTDADASTGYQPPSRKPEALGADYLIEGSTLNVWDGGSNHATLELEARRNCKGDARDAGRNSGLGPTGAIENQELLIFSCYS